MDDKKKIEIFDKCFDKSTVDYIDSLTDEQLEYLCSNVCNLVSKNSFLIKTQIKRMSKRKN